MQVRPLGLPSGLEVDRCLVAGIINVTPDSFSDGGRFVDAYRAIEHGMALVEAGADFVDVGGESTRPGAERVASEHELARVLPVVRGLAAAGVPVSVDTMRSEVARACVEAGAFMVNDVSGGLADADMHACVADLAVPYVLMHWRGHSKAMTSLVDYGADGVVAGVCRELSRTLDAAVDAGIEASRIVLDPGIGFAKEPEDNWALLSAWDQLAALGQPLLIGASRKRFLREFGAEPAERDDATAAISAISAWHGAWAVRVHEVRASRHAVAVAQRLSGGSNERN